MFLVGDCKMTSELWKLHLICEKHNLSIDKLDLIFECIRQGIFNDDFSDDKGNRLTIQPVLQDVLDDLSDAGLIFRSVK
jgi:hypothetical protein